MARKSRCCFGVWCFLWLFIFTFWFTFWFAGGDARAENQLRDFSASLWGGYYLPQDPSFKKIYSDDGEIAGFLEFSKIWPIRIEATMGIGGTRFSGHTLMTDGTPTVDKSTMALAAGYLQCSYFFRYSQEQKMVPYLGGGLDAWGFREKKEGGSVNGVKYGYHGLGGIRFLLDWLDPHAAKSSLQDYGIQNTYLVLEARWLQIDTFGEHKLDLSGPLYRIGVLWEF